MAPTLETLRRRARRRPREAEAAFALARALARREDPASAVAHAAAAVRLQPANTRYRQTYADLLNRIGQTHEAAEQYRAALAVEPGCARLWRTLGLLYERSLGDRKAARAMFVRAIEAAPTNSAAYVDLAAQCLRHEEPAAASAQVQTLLNGRGQASVVAHALARALHDLGRHHECIHQCDALLAARPEGKLARVTRALSRTALRDHDGAWVDLAEAVRLYPQDTVVCWAAVMHRIRVGTWEAAQAAFRAHWPALRRAYDGATIWDGDEIEGRNLLMACDPADSFTPSGYGDVVQFSRFATLARDRGLTVLLECPPSLMQLMGTVRGVATVVRPHDPLPDIHFRCSPLHAGLRVARSADHAHGTYVQASPALIATWRKRLDTGNGLRVGLTWAAPSDLQAPYGDPYRRKSVPIEGFRPILELRGVRIFGLQVGPAAARALEVHAGSIVDVGSAFRSFADTAAVIASLDLVISVDTSVAHVAGALGKPCWLLLPYLACPRWGMGDTTSWYPSMRLFRQSRAGDWAGVLDALQRELRARVHARGHERTGVPLHAS